MLTLKADDLAFIDDNGDPIPCKVRVISKDKIFVQVTARRHGFPLHSSFDCRNQGGKSVVVPRAAVQLTAGVIVGIKPFTVKEAP